jgi:ribose 5-phosphate isomerase B
MKIIIGADHAAFEAKRKVCEVLAGDGHAVTDAGTFSEESCDYPDFALAVARSVAEGAHERGILICGTGIGMSIAANKVKGVRAALCHNILTARMSRQHNDANVLCLGARVIGEELMIAAAREFLETEFEGGRHARRLSKIEE